MRRSFWSPTLAGAAVFTLAFLFACCWAAPTAAQQAPGGTRDRPEAERDPPMATAPRLFRAGLAGGVLLWTDEAQEPAMGRGALLGLDVESRVLPFLGFRLGASWGPSSAVIDTRGVDLHQYVVDFSAVFLPAFGRLAGAPALPFAAASLASVIHDPRAEELVTRSQSAVGLGLGVEFDPGGPLGGRAEWRSYVVSTQDLFVPEDRTGTRRRANRLSASLFWKL